MPNFSIPLSGLTAASQALSVISNNLANLNTVGFKESRASFRDLFYQAFGTNGANDPIQVGEGVALGSVTPTFTGGNLEGTGVPTDAAITGNGLFVTKKMACSHSPGPATSRLIRRVSSPRRMGSWSWDIPPSTASLALRRAWRRW